LTDWLPTPASRRATRKASLAGTGSALPPEVAVVKGEKVIPPCAYPLYSI